MKAMRVRILGFIDPRMDLYKKYEVIPKDYVIEIESLTVQIPKEFPLNKPSIVYLINNYFHIELKSDYEESLAELEVLKKQKEIEKIKKQEEAQLKAEKEKEEALVFNSHYKKLPFQWETAYKDVLSGLSENSSGDGLFKRSVVHILLKEDVNLGRLKRMQGEFLCNQDSSNYSGQYLAENKKISCMKCLEIADRKLKDD